MKNEHQNWEEHLLPPEGDRLWELFHENSRRTRRDVLPRPVNRKDYLPVLPFAIEGFNPMGSTLGNIPFPQDFEILLGHFRDTFADPESGSILPLILFLADMRSGRLFHWNIPDRRIELLVNRVAAGPEGPAWRIILAGSLTWFPEDFGERGYRYLLYRVGEATQLLKMRFRGKKLTVVDEFIDREWEQVLGLDGVELSVLRVIELDL